LIARVRAHRLVAPSPFLGCPVNRRRATSLIHPRAWMCRFLRSCDESN
jgi:hypothetical protein